MSLVDLIAVLMLSTSPTQDVVDLTRYAVEQGKKVEYMQCTQIKRTKFCASKEGPFYFLEIRKGQERARWLGINLTTYRPGELEMYRDGSLLYDKALPESHKHEDQAYDASNKLAAETIDLVRKKK